MSDLLFEKVFSVHLFCQVKYTYYQCVVFNYLFNSGSVLVSDPYCPLSLMMQNLLYFPQRPGHVLAD